VPSTVHIDVVLANRARSLHSQSKLSREDVGECWSLVSEETKSGTCDAVRMASFQVAVDESGRANTVLGFLGRDRIGSETGEEGLLWSASCTQMAVEFYDLFVAVMKMEKNVGSG
jgi:hypothetical protein